MKFYSNYDAPELQSAPLGEEIYRWVYLDEQGNEVECEKNVQEEIQSYADLVDYRNSLSCFAENGKELNNGESDNLFYGDVSDFGGSDFSLHDYISNLQNNLADYLKKINTGTGSEKNSEKAVETGTPVSKIENKGEVNNG